MAIRVAINGFGRIGRAFLRAAYEHRNEIAIVAVNDLGNINNLAYLLAHDSVYGRPPFSVSVRSGKLEAGEWSIEVLAEKDPTHLPWKELGVDVVVESTGFFTDYAQAGAHLTAGAKRVVISAPGKNSGADGVVTGAMVLMGINEEKLVTCDVSSNASCTTNAAAPVVAILDAAIGIEKAILNTTHAYTATQSVVDSPVKDEDYRRGRAAALNMAPSSTGAAKAVAEVYPALRGLFDGVAIRVPVASGSLADITFIAKRETTVAEVNGALSAAAQDSRWSETFAVTDEPIVSSDVLGLPYGSIVDLTMTRVVGGNLVKVLAWYDNEMGYAATLVRHVIQSAQPPRETV